MTTEKKDLADISRRNFLLYSCAASALCLSPCPFIIRSARASADTDYYVSNRKKFVSSFAKTAEAAQCYLSARYDADTAQIICKEAKKEFEKLLPGLPYIGGDNHRGTRWILLAGHWLSFFRPMKVKGYAVSETGRMMYDLYVEHLDTIPKDELKNKGARRFTQAYMDGMKSWADSKNRIYKDDWLADFIPGDGKNFDYGINYLHCPCFEYFKANNAKELAPYFCLVDFPEHKRMGTGLVRTKTLALGDSLCDFRYKKGRQVSQSWSTEAPKI